MEKKGRHAAGGRHFDWFILVLVGVIGYFTYTMVSQQMHLSEVDRDYQDAQQRLQAAQETNAALKKQKAELEDPVYVEKVAREELGMTKQGELPYISAKK